MAAREAFLNECVSPDGWLSVFLAPISQKEDLARSAVRSSLRLNVCEVDVLPLHQKSYDEANDEKRRNIDDKHFKGGHGKALHIAADGNGACSTILRISCLARSFVKPDGPLVLIK
jgi:hypothetical protein